VSFVYSLYLKALISNSSNSSCVRSLTTLAGTPATSLPEGTTKFSLTRAPAATTYTEYSFAGDSVIHVVKGNSSTNQVLADSSINVSKGFQDGLSILYFARMNTGKDTTLFVPCFVNEKQEIATLNFFSENEDIEIDAVDYEIDCLKLDGSTDFVSVYGFTGEFEGCFSNDEYSIPIIANMNVLIGHVTLELIGWNLNDWNPPEYKD